MNFNSLQYILFLPLVWLIFKALPHRFRWVCLLLASYYFYLSWNVSLGFLILATTVFSYVTAIAVAKTDKKPIKKLWLSLCCIFCLGVLVFFKYINFLMDGVCGVIRLFLPSLKSPVLDLMLPVGISFYTFQTLSYVIDVYRGKFAAERHFGYYALFISFFPQLVAGPIERPSDLLPQLRAEYRCNAKDNEEGIRFLLCGFFRKCVVADFCAKFVNSVFSRLGEANALAVAVAAVLFLVQMYNDFAGYSEIAIGTARLFGIKLSQNFDKPFSALCFREFFRRWHITLTRWFTDYLYIPLGGNRCGKARKVVNTFVVFALCGLWHGAAWTYLVWGLYSAFFITLETLLSKPVLKMAKKRNVDLTSAPVIALRRTVFLLMCIPASVLFRSVGFEQVFLCFKSLFTQWGTSREYFETAFACLHLQVSDVFRLALCLLCLYLLSDFAYGSLRSKKSFRPLTQTGGGLTVQNAVSYYYLAVAVALGWLILSAQSDSSTFAYFQF